MANGLSIISIIKQARPLNLVLIAIAQLVLFYGLTNPTPPVNKSTSEFYIWIACILATLLFTLGGYFINDFYDFENDKSIDKKNRFLSKSQLLIAYSITVIGNLAVCTLACTHLQKQSLLLFFVVFTGLLFSYSSYFKKNKVSGNILVSFLCASSLGIVLVTAYFTGTEISQELLEIVLFFKLFIFTLSMAREITKDCEDLKGDQKYNIDSIPIRFGINKSKVVINLFLFSLIFISIAYLYFQWNNFSNYTVILFCFIILATLIAIYYLSKAKDRIGFKIVANIQKGIFGLGIILLAFQLFMA